jgi:hypothetical protein
MSLTSSTGVMLAMFGRDLRCLGKALEVEAGLEM